MTIPTERRNEIAADPFCDRLDIELVDVSPGAARTAVRVTEDVCNFHGTPHGALLYALADAAFAAASNSHDYEAVGLETNMSYLEAVETGATLTADAEETHVGARTAEYEVTVTDPADDRVATFRGRVYKLE